MVRLHVCADRSLLSLFMEFLRTNICIDVTLYWHVFIFFCMKVHIVLDTLIECIFVLHTRLLCYRFLVYFFSSLFCFCRTGIILSDFLFVNYLYIFLYKLNQCIYIAEKGFIFGR